MDDDATSKQASGLGAVSKERGDAVNADDMNGRICD